jgi:dihydrofolate reductase
MRKLIVQTFVTLDGVMQAPGGPGEDDDGGFAYGGWSVNYWDEPMGQVMGEATSRPFAMVLGRRTYDIMAAYWPGAPRSRAPRSSTRPPNTSRRGAVPRWSGATRS